MIVQCALRHTVELSTAHIGFELAVPGFRVELREPLAKIGQFQRRQFRDLAFDLFHTAYEAVHCIDYINAVM